MMIIRAIVVSMLSLAPCAGLRIDSREMQLETGSSAATFAPGDFTWGYFVYE